MKRGGGGDVVFDADVDAVGVGDATEYRNENEKHQQNQQTKHACVMGMNGIYLLLCWIKTICGFIGSDLSE